MGVVPMVDGWGRKPATLTRRANRVVVEVQRARERSVWRVKFIQRDPAADRVSYSPSASYRR
jgi:hypothetical protein